METMPINMLIKTARQALLQHFMLFLLLTFFSVSAASASSLPKVYVNPEIFTITVGQSFTVEVKVAEVSDLYGWEFKLKWNPNLLDLVDVMEGNFLKQRGDTFFAKKANNTVGYVLVDCTLLGGVNGASGNGTLALVKFYAKVQGECILDLSETTLINSNEQPVAHDVFDGKVYSKPQNADFLNLLIATVLIVVAAFTVFWLLKFRRKAVAKGKDEIIDDEEKIVAVLKSAGGRLYQSALADRCGFSRSKISKLLREMERKGKVKRKEKGREKIVILNEG